MRVLVTGASGFIGARVVRRLRQRGDDVRCLLRPGSQTERIADLTCERADGDVRDARALALAATDCDAIVHLAGISSWGDMGASTLEDVVVRGTRNVLTAARTTGCRRVVYASSSVAVACSPTPRVFDEATPPSPDIAHLPYARAKLAAERLCSDAVKDGLDVVIVNPGEVYGPEDLALVTAGNLIDFAKSRPVFVCTGGTAVVHVDDVAAGIVAALERGRPGERYLLCGENLTIRQLAAHTLALLGRQTPIVRVPNALIRGLARLGQAWHLPLPFNPETIPYATRYWFMNNAKARRELGVDFRNAHDTLRPTLQWLQQRGHIA